MDVNGATQLCMMKADVLGCFDEIHVCTHAHRGEKIDHLPLASSQTKLNPYTTLPGWPGDLTGIRSLEEVPATLLTMGFIEDVGVPVTVLSVGPDREQTLTLKSAQLWHDLLSQANRHGKPPWPRPCSRI